MAVLKILLLFVTIQVVISKPIFKEIKMKRNFEFSLRPIKFRPITFIKEIWTPVGLVEKKHVVVKRSPEEGPPVLPMKHEQEEPELFKITLEKSFEAVPPVLPPFPHEPPPHEPPPHELPPHEPPPHKLPPHKLPPHVPPPAENEVPPHKDFLIDSHVSHSTLVAEKLPKPTPLAPPPPGFSTVAVPSISSTLPPPFGFNGRISSLPPESVKIFGASSSRAPPLGPVIPGPGYLKPSPIIGPSVEVIAIGGLEHKPKPGPPPPAEIRDVTPPGLLTDIARADKINAYLKAVDGLPLIKPPLEENLLPGNSIEAEATKDSGLSGSLVKGSRLALYFGNILLQVMSEVISSARSAISQYSKPAPI